MRPRPRQTIYKFYLFKNILSFITFGIFDKNKTKKLESFFQKYFKNNKLKCINRGRIGAYLAAKSIISNNKKKIILSPFTIFDVINMVICAGAEPVFCDVERKSITIKIDSILDVYDENVAGIMITHTHLLNTDLEKILDFAKNKNIYIIEDCAISFGTKYNNKLIGTIGDIGFFSFGIFKFVSSLNGGLIITKNQKIYNKIRSEIKNFDGNDYDLLIKNFFKSIFVSFLTSRIIFEYFSSYIIKIGFLNKINIINKFSKNDPEPILRKHLPKSYQMKISDSQSNLILMQLNNYNNDLIKRKFNAKKYYENLKDINHIIIPEYNDNLSDAWINYPIQYKDRDKLLNYLFINNADLTKYYYRNCNDLTIFKEYKINNLINIEKVVNEIIVLPTYPRYGEEQIYRNIFLIKKFFNK